MADFFSRLRSELIYSGMLQKELADRANIKKRALDAYLGAQRCMPPADVAVRLAAALDVTVEYLVNGTEQKDGELSSKSLTEDLKYQALQKVLDDMLLLSPEAFSEVRTVVRNAVRAASGKVDKRLTKETPSPRKRKTG